MLNTLKCLAISEMKSHDDNRLHREKQFERSKRTQTLK